VQPEVRIPAFNVSASPGYTLSCSATGTPPVYTALIRNATVLVNTTSTARVQVYEEGKYICMATSKFGTDVGDVSVILVGTNLLLT